MASLTELRTRLRDFTDRGSTILTDAICDLLLNNANLRMNHAHDWRGQEQVSTDLVYAAATDGLTLPAGFVHEIMVSEKDTTQTDPSRALTPIDKVFGGRMKWLESREPRLEADSVYPQVAAPSSLDLPGERLYYIWDEKIFIVPNPSASITFIIDFFGNVPDLVIAVQDTNFFSLQYPHVLQWGALAEAWAFLHEETRSTAAEQRFSALLAGAIKHDITLKMSGPSREERGT